MGNIRVRVSQAGGSEGGIVNFATGNIIVVFTPDAGTSTLGGSSIGCQITISKSGVSSGFLTQVSSGPDGDGISWDVIFNSNGQDWGNGQYTISNMLNIPRGDTISGTTGNIGSGSMPAVNTSKATVAAPAPVSFFQNIRSFFLRLFGIKRS